MTAAVFNQVLTELETGRIRGDDIELAEGLVALVRGLYAGTTDREPRNGTQSVHMRAIKTYIEAHLADRDLGPDAIARSQFISTRYLHKLFEREGITVSGWIRSRRLDRARRDLQDPALAREPIQAIATRWGFGSASHFSHAVRAAYGCSPSELRAAGPSAGDQLA
jgi:AraC-like DNA-binding protein